VQVPDGDFVDGDGSFEYGKTMRYGIGWYHDGTHTGTRLILWTMADRCLLAGDTAWLKKPPPDAKGGRLDHPAAAAIPGGRARPRSALDGEPAAAAGPRRHLPGQRFWMNNYAAFLQPGGGLTKASCTAAAVAARY